MACFIVPGTEAIVTTVITKVVEKKEGKTHSETAKRWSARLKHLNGFLWGGTALLAFEHLWHGEISPVFPFLTAAGDIEAMNDMLHEMSTVGVGMAVLVTAAWAVVTGVLAIHEKKVKENNTEEA